MRNKALILYASSTGNTEKIAKAFAVVLEEYDWEYTSIVLERETELAASGIYIDDYDLLIVGSPVITGGPAPIISQKLALTGIEPPRLYRNQMIFPGSFFRPEKAPLGIVFSTYSGESFGPKEALPTLSMLEMYLQYLFMDVVGVFACPGRKESKDMIDLLSTELAMTPNETAQLIGRFERAPEDPVFDNLSEEATELLTEALAEKQSGKPFIIYDEFGDTVWHRNLGQRPHKRDIQKAQIFLSEILEDYFTDDGSPKHASSVYTCIG